jgi:acyl-CoA synthetase (NDP forming)
MLKSDQSSTGPHAGATRTAGVVTQDVILDALFAQTGVVQMDNLDDLLDAARLLTDQPLPTGGRLAVVGNTGGAVRLAADAAKAAGLRVPLLSQALRANLAAVVPHGVGHDNPVDLGGAATPAVYAETVRAVAASGEADCLLLVVAATRVNDVPSILATLAPVLDQHRELAVSVVLIGMPDPPAVVGACRAPVFDLPERAVGALGHSVRYAAWRRQPLGGRIELTDSETDVARAAVSDALAAGAGWQPFDVTAQILTAYGIPLVRPIVVTSADSAVQAVETVGFPVALRSADPDPAHESDAGAGARDLSDADQVRAAYGAAAAAGRSGQGVLVRPLVAGQVELVAGVVHDPLFGSLVMAGFGGTSADLLENRVFRLVPMTDLDAGRMWRTLLGTPLLNGSRGIPPIDTAALEDLLSRLGRLAEDLPEVAELDLDPVLAGPDGVIVVEAKLRLAAVGAEPDATLRQLRAAD